MSYPDIGFTLEYQLVFADTAFGGKPEGFRQGGIEYRYYLREIPNTDYYDIISPYGYSGPCPMADAPNWAWFLNEFHNYCQKRNIVSEFARLHPFVEQSLSAHYEREIIYIDLTQSEEKIWKGFDKGCKSAIKDAGAIWRWGRITPEFPLVYHDTLKAKGASSAYLFDAKFFRALSPIGTTFGTGTQQAIILCYGQYAHYFLAAGQGKASNAIVWAAIKWAKAQGCKIFNLGGGLQAGDSLESFKRSFSRTTKSFYTYRKVHNQAIYDELCRAKGIDSRSEGFFPAYRRTV